MPRYKHTSDILFRWFERTCHRYRCASQAGETPTLPGVNLTALDLRETKGHTSKTRTTSSEPAQRTSRTAEEHKKSKVRNLRLGSLQLGQKSSRTDDTGGNEQPHQVSLKGNARQFKNLRRDLRWNRVLNGCQTNIASCDGRGSLRFARIDRRIGGSRKRTAFL
jgi:hypothetical protein